MNCPRCQAVNAETSGFCTNCGAPLRAGSPAPGYAPPPPAGPVAPVCMLCRSPYLQYFQNGKGICSVCKFIFRWGYTGTGQVVIMPDTGFF